ncbi:MAG TPA: hypothetical protein VNH18_32700 [Bryobacteraceae bacterium]|nr:hypothetical protein [Bryobacteraceae bacterium]
MESPKEIALHAAVRFLRKFFDVQRIHQAVDGDKNICLFVLRVDTL